MAARVALRKRREELDLSQEAVALACGVSTTAYRGWEQGGNLRVGRRRRLAEALGWTPTQLAQALDNAGPNGHAVPSWLGHLASLEQAAAEIQAFEPLVVHGLLQTEGYASAVESVGDYPADQVARKVHLRLARQAVLARKPDPLRLHVILDASALQRVAGDEEVMACQLDHLTAVAQLPNVRLQVMPLGPAVFPAAFGAFWLLTSPGADRPYMACIEDGTGPHYLDRPYDIDHHVDLFDHLAETSLSPAETVELIRHTRTERYA